MIAAELSEQLLVPLTAQQLIQAVNLVAIQVPPTGAPFIVLVMAIAAKMEHFNRAIQNAAARDVLLPVVAQVVIPDREIFV